MKGKDNSLKYLILFVLVISLLVYFVSNQNFGLSLDKSITGKFISENEKVSNKNLVKDEKLSKDKSEIKEEKFYGYIVELKDKPLLAKEKTVKTESKTTVSQGVKGVTRSMKPAVVEKPTVKSETLLNHQKAKNKILETLGEKNSLTGMIAGEKSNKKKSILMHEYINTFNGFALDIDETQANKLKQLTEVKNVYPNYEVHANLMESVPLIKADQAWQMDTDGNNCQESGKECLTGKGVTIGIIDTGVDYTNDELGGTNVKEREFQKINSEQLSLSELSWDISVDQQISMDKNRLAYYSKNKIYVYSFETGENKQIEILESGEPRYPARLYLKDNILVFVTTTDDYWGDDEAGLHYYNLDTNEQKKITNLHGIGTLGAGNGKIVYGRWGEKTGADGIFMYDISTGNITTIAEWVIPTPLIFNNLVAYSTGCGGEAVIYNTDNGEAVKHTPLNFGYILDFNNDQLLYFPCEDPLRFYLYDLNTKESKLISKIDNTQGQINANSFVSMGYWGFGGNIENGLVFFSKDFAGNKIRAYASNRIVDINLFTNSGDFDAENNMVCFLAGGDRRNEADVLCHKYDANNPYEPIKFNDKVIGGYDFVNDDDEPLDDHGHGTHVAATAAGKGRLNGIAPDAKIYAYKVLNSWGSGSFAGVMAGIERSMDPNQDGDFSDHLDIISLSLGARCRRYGLFCGPDDATSRTIDLVVDNGVTAVVAAGNSGRAGSGSIGSPATARKAITVAASDKSDNIAYFSSRGPVVWNDEYGKINYLIKPDVTAPGVNICAAQYDGWLEGYAECSPELENHIAISGTSMATPHVSGLAALILQKNPDLTPLQVKLLLKSKTVDLGRDVNTQGTGRINALDSVSFKGQPSIAKIDTNGIINSDNVEIKGTAIGKEFSSYKLDLGLGENPTEWKELINSDRVVENGVLFSAEELELRKGSANVLRLRVFNTNGEFVEDKSVVIDPGIGYGNAAKICSESPCIVDESLIGGRDNINGGNELNQPNTIQPFFCKDGGAGDYKMDESIESISVENLNGGYFRPGDAVKVKVKVFCYAPIDNLNLVYRTEKRDFSTVKAVLCSKINDFEEFEFNFNLDNTEGYHVIRGVFEFVGDTGDKCGIGPYDDNDDVVLDVQPPCKDSDNGKNYYEEGRVRTIDTKTDDMCLVQGGALTTIQENYCENGEAKSEMYQCEYGCAAEFDEIVNYEGKCNGNGALLECMDSDGNDVYTKGKVKAMAVTSNGKEERFSKTDFCNNNQVFEWTCNQNRFNFVAVDCAEGCEDGACKKKNVCVDSDGNNKNVKGNVIFNGVPYYDKCLSDKKTVVEQICRADNTRTAIQSTCEGYCDDSACQPRTCIDSDIGKNDIFTYSSVTFNKKDYWDECATSTKVTEQICKSDKTLTTKIVTCPNKKKCSRGKCLK